MTPMFKKCTVCGATWRTRAKFLSDPALVLVGYQVDFRELTARLFLFNHSCRSTLAIQAEAFTDLYDGPVFETRATGSEACGSHCLHVQDLEPCPAACECAFVREIIQIIKKRPAGVDRVA